MLVVCIVKTNYRMKYKKQYLVFLLVAFSFNTRAQVGIGTKNPDPSSVLELKSDTKGLLIPRITTIQRDAIDLPSQGLLVYNTDKNAVDLFDGISWDEFTSGYKTISASGIISTDSPANVVVSGMSITPMAGTYFINFDSLYKNSLTAITTTTSIATSAGELIPLRDFLLGLAVEGGVHTATYGNNEIIFPGVYTTSTIDVSGNFTLDAKGDPNAIFVFRTGGAFGTVAANMALVNGAQACNVFWVAVGAASIGANTTMYGTIISGGAVSVAAGTFIQGRMFSTMGAIAFGPGTAYIPSTLSKVIDIKSLAHFIMLSRGGALSNAGISNYTGGIATQSGAITGFENAVGATLYAPTDTFQTHSMEDTEIEAVVDFGLYVDDILVPNSFRSATSNAGYRNINVQGTIKTESGQKIDVRWKKTTAKIELGTRNLTLIKVR